MHSTTDKARGLAILCRMSDAFSGLSCYPLGYNIIYLHISQTPAPEHSGHLLFLTSIPGVCETSGWLPGASANRPSFRMLIWELKNIVLVSESIEKRLLSKPQCDPKVIQMALGGPFKTRGIYGVRATSGLFWRACQVISFLLLFQAPTRSGF